MEEKLKKRWTVEQHRAFVKALEQRGPDFEEIAQDMGCKTSREVHKHAFRCLSILQTRPDLEGAELIQESLTRPRLSQTKSNM